MLHQINKPIYIYFFSFSIAINNAAKRDKKGKKNNTGLYVPMRFII